MAEYHATGFLTMRQVFDPALLQGLVDATDRLWEQGRSLHHKTAHYDLAAGHSHEGPRIRRISSPAELDDVYLTVAFDSVLGDVAADLVGGPSLARRQWLPADDSRQPPSGAAQPLGQGRYLLNCNASMTPAELLLAEDSELDPGDIVAHHGLTVHGSSPNLSQAMRTTYIIQYAAADAFAYTAPVIDSRHRSRMVRGEPAQYARVEAGSIELPPDFTSGYSGIYSIQEPIPRSLIAGSRETALR